MFFISGDCEFWLVVCIFSFIGWLFKIVFKLSFYIAKFIFLMMFFPLVLLVKALK